MKKTQIVATLAFAFMLGAAIPIIEFSSSSSVGASEQVEQTEQVEPIISAESVSGISTPEAETEPEDPSSPVGDFASQELSGTVNVATAANLATALNSPTVSKITLIDDINFDTTIIVERDADALPLELDLGQHNIANTSGKSYAIFIKQGTLSITGQGTISGQNGLEIQGSDQNIVNFTTVSIGKDVTVQGQIYAIAINDYNSNSSINYGTKLTIDGTLRAGYGVATNGRIKNTVGAPQIIINDSAVIIASGYDDSTPLYAAGNATWTIGAATLTGKSGLNIRAGEFTLNGTSVSADGEMRNPSTGSGGIDGVGVAFQIEHHAAYADNITLNINGGTYTSTNGDVVYEYGKISSARATTSAADINITAGTFVAGPDRAIFGGTVDQNNIEISGGTFRGTDVTTADFAKYLVGNLKLDADGNVVANNHTPSNPNTPTSPSEAPDDPSDTEEPSDPTSGNTAPETGVNHRISEISAVSTAIPMILGAFIIVAMACGQKIFARHRAAARAGVEIEIDEQIAEIIDAPEDTEEPVIERFVAEPILRDEPQTTPVDSFIFQK